MTIHVAKDLKLVPIESLKPYERNARTHSEEQIAQIAASIREFGFTNPILIDGENGIIAGHGRLLAAKSIGLAHVPVIDLSHLTPAQKRAYIIADNRLALSAGWDNELLAAEIDSLREEDFDLDLLGFTDEELADLEIEPDRIAPAGEEDEVPEAPAEPKVVPGEIYILGKHRLMCGDSTAITDVERLMAGAKADCVFTDPPYGVSYQSNMRTQSDKFSVIENDDTFLTEWVNVLPVVSTGWVFVWTTWKVLQKWIEITRPIGEMTNLIVWDKGGGGIGDLSKTFSTDHELAIVFNRGAEITGKRIGSVWSIGKDRAIEYIHPTQKPVALSETAIGNVTHRGAIVLDLFGGSGSTLIGCEKLGRSARIMELDPRYVAVILDRWEKYTGKKAYREDGKPWAEIKNAVAQG